MRNSNRLGVLTLTLTAALLFAGPALAADVSVGAFVQELARARHLDAATPQGALDSLEAAGLRLPSNLDLGKRLTEQDVSEISRSVGLNLTTSRPGASFSSTQVDQFFESFSGELGVGSGTAGGGATAEENPGQGGGPGNGDGGPPFDPFAKGKGKNKGKGKSSRTPTDPE